MVPQKQTIRQRKQAFKKIMLNTTFRALILAVVGVFGVLYVAQTSSISTKGYDMNDLQSRITELERDNEKLEYEIAKYRSMRSIQERLSGMDLVAAQNVEYITLVGTVVALR